MNYKINLQKREKGQKVLQELKTSGFIAGVLYGPDREPVPISVKALDFEKLYSEAGSSALVDCKFGDEESVKLLIQDVDCDPVTDRIRHVDFRQIKMGEKMRFTVPIEFVGESAAVGTLNGTFVKNTTEVEIECLPKDLVANLEADISKLATFEDTLTVTDLKAVEGVEILVDENEKLAYVEAPRTEEEIAALEEEVKEDVSEVEGAAEDEAAEGKDGDDKDNKGGDKSEDKKEGDENKGEKPKEESK